MMMMILTNWKIPTMIIMMMMKPRGALWSYWSTKEGKTQQPEIIKDYSHRFNLENGKDVNDHFGFRVSYMMFKYQRSYEDLMEDSELAGYFENSGGGRKG